MTAGVTGPAEVIDGNGSVERTMSADCAGAACGPNPPYRPSGDSHTVTLTGHVVLAKDKDVMRGTSLVVNMNTGESHLTAQGAPGNRVQGLFVQERQPSKSASKPAGSVQQ